MRSPAFLLLVALGLFVARPGAAVEFWMVTSEADSKLYKLETSTGGTTLIGATGVGFLSDIAIDGSGNMVATNGTDLYSVNTTSGAATYIGGPFSNVFFVSGLDYDSGGVLWGVDTSVNTVVTINPATGADTFQYATGWQFDSDIAHDSGDIFYSSGPFLSNRNLVELDVVAQTATNEGVIASGTSPTAMDFDGSGELYLIDGLTGDVFKIADPATSSTGVFQSATGNTVISGLTFQTPTGTPVPILPRGLFFVLAFGLGLSAFLLHRRRAAVRGRSVPGAAGSRR